MARYVEDVALVLNAIYGPDKRDGSVADAPFRWTPDATLSGLRIAYVKSAFDGVGQGRGGGAGRGGAANPEVVAAANAERKRLADGVLATYQKLGAKLEPVDLPEGLLAAVQPINFILEVEAAASFDDITRSGDVNLLSSGTSRSTWPNTFRQGRLVPAVEYIRAMRARTLLMRQADDFFSKYDAVIEPNTGGTLSLTNLTGHPAIGLKCGFLPKAAAPGYENGQPVVFMITGRLYEEATICRVALAYEQATEWKDRHPVLES
jgi:Asp-tRNA(Asn)/Glu-tRNA(Gln) amidotransferase A subunit family amidase